MYTHSSLILASRQSNRYVCFRSASQSLSTAYRSFMFLCESSLFTGGTSILVLYSTTRWNFWIPFVVWWLEDLCLLSKLMNYLPIFLFVINCGRSKFLAKLNDEDMIISNMWDMIKAKIILCIRFVGIIKSKYYLLDKKKIYHDWKLCLKGVNR